MPKDPIILLSFVNTALRDRFKSLNELKEFYGSEADNVEATLAIIDYHYDEEKNAFV